MMLCRQRKPRGSYQGLLNSKDGPNMEAQGLLMAIMGKVSLNVALTLVL